MRPIILLLLLAAVFAFVRVAASGGAPQDSCSDSYSAPVNAICSAQPTNTYSSCVNITVCQDYACLLPVNEITAISYANESCQSPIATHSEWR